MQASERDEVLPRAVPVTEQAGAPGTSRAGGAAGAAGVSMRDLLASCLAASAVSTPPRAPVAERPGSSGTRRHPEAA